MPGIRREVAAAKVNRENEESRDGKDGRDAERIAVAGEKSRRGETKESGGCGRKEAEYC